MNSQSCSINPAFAIPSAGLYADIDGSGLFPIESSFNHSCSFNASVSCEGQDVTLTIRAKRDIKKNDEICLSYIGNVTLGRC